MTEQFRNAFENRAENKVRMQTVVEEEVEQANEKWGAVEWMLLGIVAIEGAYLLVNWLPRLFG